jgi:hypothetical protein
MPKWENTRFGALAFFLFGVSERSACPLTVSPLFQVVHLSRLLLETRSHNRNIALGLTIISIRYIWILNDVLGRPEFVESGIETGTGPSTRIGTINGTKADSR